MYWNSSFPSPLKFVFHCDADGLCNSMGHLSWCTQMGCATVWDFCLDVRRWAVPQCGTYCLDVCRWAVPQYGTYCLDVRRWAVQQCGTYCLDVCRCAVPQVWDILSWCTQMVCATVWGTYCLDVRRWAVPQCGTCCLDVRRLAVQQYGTYCLDVHRWSVPQCGGHAVLMYADGLCHSVGNMLSWCTQLTN